MTPAPARQPYLHDLLCAVRAPAFVLCGSDGAIDGDGVRGVYVNDRRVLSMSTLSLAGATLASVLGEFTGADATRSVLIARGLGDCGADPTVWVERRRELSAGLARDVIEIRSTAHQPVRTELTLTLQCDLAEIAAVKSGRPSPALPAAAVAGGLSWADPEGVAVTALTDPPSAGIDAGQGLLTWPVVLEPGGTARFQVDVRVDDPGPVVVLGCDASVIADIAVLSSDVRIPLLVEQALADLHALELRDVTDPDDHFMAAGAPWFLTMFGRDSILTARMLLPLGTRLAAGTLRALARRQGTKVDDTTAEAPGKILHEIRRVPAEHGAFGGDDRALSLPPVYYGTVDATPLWIILLHDAWRWGMPAAEVAKLLDAMTAALGWLGDYGQDDSGFISYLDSAGHGLVNQGWKDSADSIQFEDGRLAQAPLALSEVQGYAYQAAVCGADLLDAFDRPGGAEWRTWAAALAERFRARFWVHDEHGPYPAVALDRHGQPADSVASNMGHLLGTGILNNDESALVAARLGSAALSSGYGLRSMAATSAGYSPLSYHGGSVWTHDTAIAIHGLGIATSQGVPGAALAATGLISGLLEAAPGFDYRLPELYSGEAARRGGHPTPYPASCRPQAWAAASAITLLTAMLGLRPDATAGGVQVQALAGGSWPELTVRGLSYGDDAYDVQLSSD
ncbi:MAG: Amylo-alpha6-glucosidase, partial [Pseudonocardiales bacterium]|nr:Amylo-alpha6-glucosidase [Pseudonocardiales bacterium]